MGELTPVVSPTLAAPDDRDLPVAPPRAAPEPRVVSDPLASPATPWRDLALNRPGEAVGARANALRQEAPVTSVDHVVVGPVGVFTVNAKHHPDAKVWAGGSTIIVNGHRTDYVRNSRYEAQRASKLLSGACGFSVPVLGVLAFVGCHGGFEIKSQPSGVHVTARKRLVSWLAGLGPTLTDEQVNQIYEVARRSTTWTRTAV